MTTTTLADDLAYIRELAESQMRAARNTLQWQADAVRVELGLAEVVDWPEEEPLRRLRRGESPRMAPQPEGTRTLFCRRSCAPYGHVHLIRDTL